MYPKNIVNCLNSHVTVVVEIERRESREAVELQYLRATVPAGTVYVRETERRLGL
jgi:hypothetical protein